MIIKRTTLLLILLAMAVSVTLFVVKYQVQDLEDEFRRLSQKQIVAEESIHVLKAEWSHLNQPARLRQLAGRYLEMGPLDAERVGTAERILDNLPDRREPVLEEDGAGIADGGRP